MLRTTKVRGCKSSIPALRHFKILPLLTQLMHSAYTTNRCQRIPWGAQGFFVTSRDLIGLCHQKYNRVLAFSTSNKHRASFAKSSGAIVLLPVPDQVHNRTCSQLHSFHNLKLKLSLEDLAPLQPDKLSSFSSPLQPEARTQFSTYSVPELSAQR